MRVVSKDILGYNTEETLKIYGVGLKPLHFAEWDGLLTVWFEKDNAPYPPGPQESIEFVLVQTGETFKLEGYAYLGTTIIQDGSVYHCYYAKRVRAQ